MDMDPGEGTSDGRVKRKANNIEVEIKQEPDIKEEPSDGNEFGLVTRSNERFGAGVATVTLNIELLDESESNFDFESDLNGVKEEVKCKETKSGENSSTNSGSNGNEPNADGGQGDGPMVQSNVNRTRLNSNVNGKKRDGSRKQNKRKIPRNKVAKKRTEQKCRVCGYVKTRKADLARHIRIHTGDKPFKCDVCSKSSAQKRDLIRHKKVHSGEKRFECYICFKSFAQKNNLNFHLRTHIDELPHSCLNCGQRFASGEARQSHEKRCKHRRFECYLCGYECFANGNLKRHMQAKHTGEHQFQCEICGKKFIQNDSLNKLLATHRDQYLFGCIKCRLAFIREEDKTAHEKICGRRQYQCHICNVFKLHTTNLRNHMRVHHTGEKPFHRKWCDKCFIQKHDAEKHMNRIHRFKK